MATQLGILGLSAFYTPDDASCVSQPPSLCQTRRLTMIEDHQSTIRRVALISDHAGPCAPLGGPDGGGQNVYVAGLATELGSRGIEVTVYTRRQAPDLPRRFHFAHGVTVEYVDAGPCTPISKDVLLPYMPIFGAALHSRWTINRPDIAHAHYWMSGLA